MVAASTVNKPGVGFPVVGCPRVQLCPALLARVPATLPLALVLPVSKVASAAFLGAYRPETSHKKRTFTMSRGGIIVCELSTNWNPCPETESAGSSRTVSPRNSLSGGLTMGRGRRDKFQTRLIDFRKQELDSRILGSCQRMGSQVWSNRKHWPWELSRRVFRRLFEKYQVISSSGSVGILW
jgi:hypothetical protein